MIKSNPSDAPHPDEFPFIGDWVLQPERSKYEFGIPPQCGTYRIKLDDNGWLTLQSRWHSASGRERLIEFEGQLNGGTFPYFSYPVADALSFKFQPPSLLTSFALKNGTKVHWAERQLDATGTVMTIAVFGWYLSQIYRNEDVYLKVPLINQQKEQ